MKVLNFNFIVTTLCCVFSIQMSTAQSVSYLEVPSWSFEDLTIEQNIRYQKLLNMDEAESIHPILLNNLSESQVGGILEIDLPAVDCGLIVIKPKQVEFVSEDNYFWYGEVVEVGEVVDEDCALCSRGFLMMTSKDGKKFGTLNVNEQEFAIRDLGGKQVAVEISSESYGGGCGVTGEIDNPEDLVLPDNFKQIAQERVMTGNCNIKVLVLYTASAGDRIDDVEMTADNYINYTNQALQNSNIPKPAMRFVLAGVEETTFDETAKTPVQILSQIDNVTDVVHPRREFYNADIVVLIVDEEIAMLGNSAGAILNSAPNGEPNPAHRAYAYVRVSLQSRIFAHEVGHLLGGHHEVEEHESNLEDHAHKFSYKTGFIFKCTHHRRTAIWSQNLVSVLPYYSNPDVKYRGAKTGIVGERDNANILKNNACTVANYYTGDITLSTTISGASQVCVNSSESYFSSVSGAPGPYNYTWSISTDGGVTYGNPVSTSSSYILNGNLFDLFQTIWIRLRVTASNGEVDFDFASVIVVPPGEECPENVNSKSINSIKSSNAQYQITVFPNPTSDNINFSFTQEKSEPIEISLMNIQGKVVKSKKLLAEKGKHQYSFNEIPIGVYFLHLTGANQTQVQRSSFNKICFKIYVPCIRSIDFSHFKNNIMKDKIFIMLFITASLVYLSCKKESTEIPPREFDGQAFLNNELINLSTRARMQSIVSIVSNHFDSNNYLDGEIVFNLALGTLQEQQFRLSDSITNDTTAFAFYGSYGQDGDVVTGLYHVIENDDFEDFLHITHYDEETGLIRGEFQGNYVLDSEFQFNDVDTVVIENGTFEVILTE